MHQQLRQKSPSPIKLRRIENSCIAENRYPLACVELKNWKRNVCLTFLAFIQKKIIKL